MYLVAVCDDHKGIREAMVGCIMRWNPQIYVDVYSSGEELLEHYKPYQAVFLDIDMGGINGIETGQRIRGMDKETKIVYLTAYGDYVSGAFGVHAFQYLLKPVREKEIHHVLDEIFQYSKTQKSTPILEFETGKGMVCLPVDQIYYFEYESRRVQIVTDRENYYMKDKIGTVLERMNGFGFSMPHQSFVVNMLHVKKVKGFDICLDNGMVVPLAQNKQKKWKQELVSYFSDRLEAGGK